MILTMLILLPRKIPVVDSNPESCEGAEINNWEEKDGTNQKKKKRFPYCDIGKKGQEQNTSSSNDKEPQNHLCNPYKCSNYVFLIFLAYQFLFSHNISIAHV